MKARSMNSSFIVIPTFIGEGIPLIAPRHRTVPLKLLSVKKFSGWSCEVALRGVRSPSLEECQ